MTKYFLKHKNPTSPLPSPPVLDISAVMQTNKKLDFHFFQEKCTLISRRVKFKYLLKMIGTRDQVEIKIGEWILIDFISCLCTHAPVIPFKFQGLKQENCDV